MKPYVIALAVGLLVGVIYGILNVRSPAPPVVALVGLLGILIGEQIPPVARRMLSGQPVGLAAIRAHGAHHVFGPLPGGPAPDAPAPPGHAAVSPRRPETAA